MYRFSAASAHVQAIHTPSGEICYLIEGSRKALLIDTSTGLGNIRQEAQQHTDRPITAVLTHGHLDHASGAACFEEVYMNLLDLPVYQSIREDDLRGYIEMNTGAPCTEPLQPHAPDACLKDLQEGMVFDLGDLHVSAWALGGHTPGSMVFLVEEEGILITGDAANTATFLFLPDALPLHVYRDNLVILQEKLRGKYSRVFLSHRDVDTSPALLEEGIALCNAVLAGKSDAVPMEFMGTAGCFAKQPNEDLTLNDGTCFNLVYSPDNL